MSRAIITIVAAVGATVGHAGVFDGQDVVIVCSEQTDGAVRAECALGSPLSAWVLAEGGRLIDADQAARVRQSVRPHAVTSAADLKGVDFLDAELAIIASTIVEQQPLPPQLKNLQGNMKSAFISERVRVLNVASAAFVADAQASAPGVGLSMRQILEKQQASLWGEGLKPKLTQALAAARQSRDVDLWIYDLPGTAEVAAISQELTRLGLATSSSQKGAQRGLAKWRVSLAPGVDSAALSAGLERSRLFLVGQGLTPHLVSMAYAPRDALRVDVKLVSEAGAGTPAWLANDLEGRARATLLAKDGVRVIDGGPALVTLAVRTKATKVGVTASAALTDADGKALGTFSAAPQQRRSAIEAGVDDVIGRSLATLFEAFKKDPVRYGDLRLLQTTSRALTIATDVTTISLSRTAHGDAVIGAVTVSPRLDEQTVTVTVGDGEVLPASFAGAKEVPLATGVVDASGLRISATPAAAALTAPLTTTMTISVVGRLGERPYRGSEVVRVQVLPETAVAWTTPADVTRVLEPTAPWRATVRASAAAKTPLERAQQVWDVLAAWGVRYEARDDGAVDVVQAPSETIARGVGDDGDLLALTASALLAADVPVAVAPSPNAHEPPSLLVGTGLDAAHWAAVAADVKDARELDGVVFVPLDVTARATGFGAAVAVAAKGGAHRRGTPALLTPSTTMVGVARAAPDALVKAEARARRERVLVLAVKPDVKADAAFALAAARAVSVAMAGFGACDVASEEDLRRVLDLEANKQLVGCTDDTCLAEVGDALGAKIVVYGSLSKKTLTLKVWDIAAARVASVVEVPRARASSGAALAEATDTLLVPVLANAGLSTARAGRSPASGISLPRDPGQRLRAFLLRGDVEGAVSAAQALPAARRALATAAVEVARGEHASALQHLRVLRGDGARKNELVSAVAQGDRALAVRLVSEVGEARAKGLVATDGAIAASLAALLAGTEAPGLARIDVAAALAL